MTKTITSVTTDDGGRSPTVGQKTDGTDRHRGAFSPDTGWAWVVAIASLMNVFLQMGLYRGLGVFVVELMEVYEAPTAKVSVIFTSAAVGFGVTAILYIFGVGDIVHERALVAASCFLACCGHLVTFFSTRIEHINVLGFCTGAAMQIGMACSFSMIGQYFHKRRSVASGIAMCGVSLGVLVFPPVLQWLLDEYTYRGTALISAALTLNSLVCCSLMRSVPRTTKKETVLPEQNGSNSIPATGVPGSQEGTMERDLSKPITITGADDKLNCQADGNVASNGYSNAAYVTEMEDFVSEPSREVTQVSRKGTKRNDRRVGGCFESVKLAIKTFCLKDTKDKPVKASGLRKFVPSLSILKHPAMPFLQIFMLFHTVGSECVVQFYPASTRELGMSEYQSAFLLSIAGIGDFLSRIGLGLLGDYNFMARYKLVAIPQFVLGTACFLSRFATEFWSQGIFAIIIGLTYGTGYAYRAVILIDFFGFQELNRLMGICNFMSSLGFVAGSPLIGFLRDFTGDYGVPMQTLGAMLFAAGLSLMVAGACSWRHRRKRGQHDFT